MFKDKEEWMQNKIYRKNAAYRCRDIFFIRQSTVHHISTRSPMSQTVVNGLYKPDHPIHPQEMTWSADG